MKKILILITVVFATVLLSSCSAVGDESSTVTNNVSTENSNPLITQEVETFSSEQSLATLSYLSAGFLDFSNQNIQTTVANMSQNNNSNSQKTVIEDNLDSVNIYFDRLKAIIDNGVDDFGSITDEIIENENYSYKLSFLVNDETYLIYYNIDELTNDMTGVIVVGSVEYVFEVIDNITEYSYEHKETNTENKLDEDDSSSSESSESSSSEPSESSSSESSESSLDVQSEEQSEEYFGTSGTDSESKMVLVAHNGDDYIRIVYKTEIEDDETTTKFDIKQLIAGVEKESKLKITTEENEYKITLEESDERYMFQQDTSEDLVVYKLIYKVDGVNGMIKITEITDELGNVTYNYHIVEANKEKNIEKKEPKSKGFDSDDDDELEIETNL